MTERLTEAISAVVIAAMGEVAREIILPRFRQLSSADVRTKTHPTDFVTVADEESERWLTERLTALLPEALVLGEELAAADPALWDRLLRHDPLWIVDPIDGTSNFVHGVPRFAVVVALIRHGKTEAGWIHDPLAKSTLWATRGGGAWIASTDPPESVRVTLSPAPENPAALTAAIYHRDFAALKGKFAHILRQGSAAHDYWACAQGRLHVLAYRQLKPWDHAAGVLIHAEAGGYNAMLSGLPYDPRERVQSGLLCAPSQGTWLKLKQLAGKTLPINPP